MLGKLNGTLTAANCLIGGFNLACGIVNFSESTIFGLTGILSAAGSAIAGAIALSRVNHRSESTPPEIMLAYDLCPRMIDEEGNIVTVTNFTAYNVTYRLPDGRTNSRCLKGFLKHYRAINNRDALLAVSRRKLKQSWRRPHK
jgi:hypothetical protein